MSVSDVAAAARVSLHRALVVAGHAASEVHFCDFGGLRQVLQFYFGHEDPLCHLAAERTLVHVAFRRRLLTLAQLGCLFFSCNFLIMRLNLLVQASIAANTYVVSGPNETKRKSALDNHAVRISPMHRTDRAFAWHNESTRT